MPTELFPRLSLLTLTVDNEAEYWEEKLEFIGTTQQWNAVRVLENTTMSKGTIVWVSSPKENKKKEVYTTVSFKMEDGSKMITYVVKGYKNELNWEGILVVGNILDGLKLKRGQVDADSTPKVVGFVEAAPPKVKEKKECQHPISRETLSTEYRHCNKCNKLFKV